VADLGRGLRQPALGGAARLAPCAAGDGGADAGGGLDVEEPRDDRIARGLDRGARGGHRGAVGARDAHDLWRAGLRAGRGRIRAVAGAGVRGGRRGAVPAAARHRDAASGRAERGAGGAGVGRDVRDAGRAGDGAFGRGLRGEASGRRTHRRHAGRELRGLRGGAPAGGADHRGRCLRGRVRAAPFFRGGPGGEMA
jgi:hypothetical protein